MTGDGVNDAAARQAEVGVAVAGAVDVAKSAAAWCAAPGLAGILGIVARAPRLQTDAACDQQGQDVPSRSS
jgi:H+-transporting ATPase